MRRFVFDKITLLLVTLVVQTASAQVGPSSIEVSQYKLSLIHI